MESRKYIDLHLHTTCSDGERTPEEMIHDTNEAGLSAIALTDHNCFAIRRTKMVGSLEVIPGAEFSSYYHCENGKSKEVHVVGLFFENVDDEIFHIFDGIRKDAYVEAILKKLNELGFPMSMEELCKANPAVHKLGRAHIAELMVQKGYARDRDEAMDRWIGNFSPYYLNPVDYVKYMDFETAVKSIADHNGLPILAHPYHYQFHETQIEEMIQRFRTVTEKPLGIEVYYRDYGEGKISFLKRMAEKYDLLISASSDNHFRGKPFAKGDYGLLEKMKERMSTEQSAFTSGGACEAGMHV